MDTLQRAITTLDAMADRFWEPPAQMESRVAAVLRAQGWHGRIVVSGETENVSAYLVDSETVTVVMPSGTIHQNVVLSELDLLWSSLEQPVSDRIVVVPRTVPLEERLRLPRVMLVNLSVVENFPVPRLSLSVGSMALICHMSFAESREFNLDVTGAACCKSGRHLHP